MPRRKDPHEQGGDVKAVFFAVCEDLGRLTPQRAREIIAKMLGIIENENTRDHQSFVEYAAIVEHGQSAGAGIIDGEGLALPGQAEFVRLEQVEEVLATKREHQQPKNRRPGNKSYVPEPFLRPEVCALLIGSRRFLIRNLTLYLESRGPLAEQLIDEMAMVAGLTEASRARRTADTYREVDVRHGQFYSGNFDALWERIIGARRTTEELLAHLEPALAPSVSEQRTLIGCDADSQE